MVLAMSLPLGTEFHGLRESMLTQTCLLTAEKAEWQGMWYAAFSTC